MLLPVVLLALVGLVSIREDRSLARHDAQERAQALADLLAQKTWNSLASLKAPAELAHYAFQVDATGHLVFPRPMPAVPVARPLDPAVLTPEQSRLWRLARAGELGNPSAAAVRQAYAEFLDSKPPADFAAAARYAEGLWLLKESRPDQASEAFQAVARDYPDAVGETGLPLRPLADLKLLELGAKAQTHSTVEQTQRLDLLCSNAVNFPSPISAVVLKRVLELSAGTALAQKAQAWHELFQQQEFCRRLYAAASPFSLNEPTFWFTLLPDAAADSPVGPEAPGLSVGAATFQPPEGKWKAIFRLDPRPAWFFEDSAWLAFEVRDGSSNHWYVCRTESELGYRLPGAAFSPHGIPDYFGVAIELAGKQLTSSAWDLHIWHMQHYMGGKGMGQNNKQVSNQLATDVLATATPSGAATDALKVKIYLTSPSALYHHQQTRNFWFGALIAASALAAFVGWFRAWRAFHRQQELAALKSNFVSSVSHELRAPIASVRLMAESLERGKVSEAPKQHEYFGFIVQECRRLSSLIENVLDFSRIEQGRKEYEFEPIDLLSLIRQTVQLMEPCAAEKQIKLILQLPDPANAGGDFQPKADGKALQQALANLLDNAIKHSPPGETVTVGLELKAAAPGVPKAECVARNAPPVEVRSAQCGTQKVEDAMGTAETRETSLPESPSRSTLLLWVEDHGEGIPAEEHGKIFERFYRRGSELRRETQGVGIGLSIVKHIVEAHGGRVLVRSGVGQGSRFTIELPLWNAS